MSSCEFDGMRWGSERGNSQVSSLVPVGAEIKKKKKALMDVKGPVCVFSLHWWQEMEQKSHM